MSLEKWEASIDAGRMRRQWVFCGRGKMMGNATYFGEPPNFKKETDILYLLISSPTAPDFETVRTAAYHEFVM